VGRGDDRNRPNGRLMAGHVRAQTYHACIILTTPESAETAAFGRFIEEKKRAYQLKRVVIDKCHMIPESMNQWCPKGRQLEEMAGRGV
jgi:hypothetical protein